MKIIAISDTHGQHQNLAIPSGDILIHSGDVSGRGSRNEILSFLDWFSSQSHKYKIFIAGNHDFFFEKNSGSEITIIIPPGITYLNDSGITIEGINIWGSPITPWFYDWAFNRIRGNDIRKHWELIPTNTDILITHGPPFGILDRTAQGINVGSEDLLEFINKIRPKFHVFGHIHEGFGIREINNVTYINASVLDERYRLVNEPQIFTI